MYSNWKRQSVVGLSFDFEVYNMLGFFCYSIFNCAFYFSPSIRKEYERMHHGHPNAVQLNDVFFALHAAFVTSITLLQCVVYERGQQRVSRTCCFITITSLLLIIVCYFNCNDRFELLYRISYIKLGVSLVKYIPQVILNYRRKSTEGWTIYNVLLDFSGGILSIVQLLFDSFILNDWSSVTGDPVKFGLGFVSIVFDVLFMIQHYLLYAERPVNKEKEPLIMQLSIS